MMKNNIMLKKIILPLVLLMFTQQEFCASKNEFDLNGGEEQDKETFWETINNWVNVDSTKSGWEEYPKLWWLWAFVDNVPFQYGNSKIWKHGEAYYGLSNGIGFFPSALNFGWLKIGIGDAHINVINLILDYFKNFIHCKTEENFVILDFLLTPIFVNVFFNIHIISVKILNCIKIKLIAPLTLIMMLKEDEWYITYDSSDHMSWWYGLLSPRIEINIPGIIDLF